MATSKTPDALAQHSEDGVLGPPASSPAVTGGKAHRSWYSRGYLPHFDEPGLVQHIVFGLADALPRGVKALKALQSDRVLDAGHGACLLKNADCASFVENALLHADGARYHLIAWCVMPNHVHVIAEQIEGFPLGEIVQSWKSTSAHLINRRAFRKGRLWRREYFDRFMRDEDHLSSSVYYVEQNPVTAKLVTEAENWRWSSAWRRKTAGEDAGGPRSAP